MRMTLSTKKLRELEASARTAAVLLRRLTPHLVRHSIESLPIRRRRSHRSLKIGAFAVGVAAAGVTAAGVAWRARLGHSEPEIDLP